MKPFETGAPKINLAERYLKPGHRLPESLYHLPDASKFYRLAGIGDDEHKWSVQIVGIDDIVVTSEVTNFTLPVTSELFWKIFRECEEPAIHK